MKRQNDRLLAVDRRPGWRTVLFMAAMTLGCSAQLATAQALRYQDADDFIPNISPVEAINSASSVGEDNLWGFRNTFGSGVTVFESPGGSGMEDSPELTQTLTGLVPNTNYDLYAVYWTDEDENWSIKTGTTSGNLTAYNFTGNNGSQPTPDTLKGYTAGAAIWDALPVATSEGTIFTQRPADPLVMLLAPAGAAMSDGSGQLEVFVDDVVTTPGVRRTWFDGVAYVEAGTPIAITSSLDRTTGEITITNPTAQNFEIKSYQIASHTAGAFDATAWTPLSDTDPSWDITAPVDEETGNPALVPYTGPLSETNATGTVTLDANGGELSFGNVWNPSPFDHVLVYLTLADDTLAVLSPDFIGGEGLENGDFDLNGTIDLADYEILLNNLHSNVAGLTTVERYHLGNIRLDGMIDYNDFKAFREVYDAANGPGAFAQIAGQVPEPSSLVLLVGIAAASIGFFRQRGGVFRQALVACCLMIGLSGSAFAVDIAIDLDSNRLSGSDISGVFPTQTGFTSWDVTDVVGDADAPPFSSLVVDGITFEIFGLAGANQSRLRMLEGVPNGGGGDFNDLLADFVYNEGAGGRGIGLRISGLEVGSYAMQSWHFDGDSGVRGVENYTQIEVRDPAVDGSSVTLGNAIPFSEQAASFTFDVTSPGQVREIIFREDDTGTATEGGDQNRARLNGFTLRSPVDLVELTLEVNTTTGATRIVNQQGVPFDVSYYEVRSDAGSLNPGGWASLDDGEAGSTLGDYNGNGSVDAADYTVWRDTLDDDVTPGTGADGNNDGTVNQDDYTVWRDHFGETGSDPLGSGWDEAPSSNANIVSEVNLESMMTFETDDSASLGNLFSAGATQDLRFYYADPAAESLRFGLVQYVTGAGSGSTVVPEPTAFVLMLIGAACAGLLRKRG